MTTTKTAKKATTGETPSKVTKTPRKSATGSPGIEGWKGAIATFVKTGEKVKIDVAGKKVPVRTMETDGFTDKEDWLAWLDQGKSLLALAQALEDDIRISDCRPLLRTPCERTEEAKRLVEEAVSNLTQAANVFLSGISCESRMELSKCLAVICQIPDRDNAQMLAKLSPEEVFDVFERKKYQDANRSEMASFILNSTLRRMKKAYLAVDKSFIF
ncbi:hypothetical protein [Akkermansia muciniphila]|uniref:hypothetical protein n=1 Tax=Akkermansia muciniphila TaxID=239935 RepID=UPI00201DAC5F|nr:hypothetical protein [Akkermansia muciniphila]MCL6682227.1 hypothetical protein [Akkermansia muciniphila]